MEFRSSAGPLPPIPDHLTLPQFTFDCEHVTKPKRSKGMPWFIDDDTGRKIGEDELRTRVLGLSRALHLKYGIDNDDVVLVFSRNHVDYPVVIWAVHSRGAIISGANPDYNREELLYQLQVTKASVLVVHPEGLERAIQAAEANGISKDRIIIFDTDSGTSSSSNAPITIDALIRDGLKADSESVPEIRFQPGEARTKIACLSFSSGTTGRPKAVAFSHFALIANAIQLAAHCKVNEEYAPWNDRRYRPGDVALGVLPFFHIYGLAITLCFAIHAGMTVVVVPKFDFTKMLNSIVRYRISHLYIVPPMAILLCQHPSVQKYDLRPYVRMIMSGAAPLAVGIEEQLHKMFPDAHIGQAYGMTETTSSVSMWPITQKHGPIGSSGQLVPGAVARVVKPDGSLAGYGEEGEMYVKLASIALGYFNDEQATKETFIDGWLRTGDQVMVDRHGEVRVVDRLKELIKVKGFQVAPAELEGCLLDHPDVIAACVVGVEDYFSGELPFALVVLTDEARLRAKDSMESIAIKESIMKHVGHRKIHYKHICGVEFVAQLPMSASGKILRRLVRDEARKLHRNRRKAKL